MYEGNYKWSYDPRDSILTIWAVDSSTSSASPQHYSMTGNDGYEFCSQGRLIVAGDDAVGVIYRDRPFDTDGRDELHQVAKAQVESEIERDVRWNVE